MDFPRVAGFRRKAYNERVDLWSLGVLYLGEVSNEGMAPYFSE